MKTSQKLSISKSVVSNLSGEQSTWGTGGISLAWGTGGISLA